jgi:SAM-dependent methyltransferase
MTSIVSARPEPALPPAVLAFDAMAARFDERFGPWKSVAAQRAAVRRELLAAFRTGASLLELGGGTGEDALYLAQHGYHVCLTDGAPAMVERARAKVERAGAGDRVAVERVALEELGAFAAARENSAAPLFEGGYSNFAAFNCVEELREPARALARLLAPRALLLLVVFGPFSPGEIVVLSARGDVRGAFRRLSRRDVPAKVGGHAFRVSYPSPAALSRAFEPWFVLRRTVGIGVFVPPSSAEPWISGHPHLLALLERLDRLAGRPLALLGDHVLVALERTAEPI